MQTFESMAVLEPELLELERQVDAVVDDGSGSFFCSNHEWLPLASRLRALVGVTRPGWRNRQEGDPRYDSHAFEACYLHLSRRMPPCRGCGCEAFMPWRDRQLAERAAAGGGSGGGAS